MLRKVLVIVTTFELTMDNNLSKTINNLKESLGSTMYSQENLSQQMQSIRVMQNKLIESMKITERSDAQSLNDDSKITETAAVACDELNASSSYLDSVGLSVQVPSNDEAQNWNNKCKIADTSTDAYDELNATSSYLNSVGLSVQVPTFDDLMNEMLKLNKSITKIATEIRNIDYALYEAELRLSDLEQYTRRNSILIHGLQDIPVTNNEFRLIRYVTEKLNDMLNMDIKFHESEIDTAHILPRRNKVSNQQDNGQAPPAVIIVKYVRRCVRNKIFYSRRALKGTSVFISEHLNKTKMKLLKSAKEAFNYKDVWSNQGNIYVNYNDKKCIIRDERDIDCILSNNQDYKNYRY